MSNLLQKQIFEFNRLVKAYDDIYRRAARQFDLPELALWVLYVVYQKPDCTQRDIVDIICRPKQSVSSVLRTLLADDCIVFECGRADRRCKQIRLTEKGRRLAQTTAAAIVEAEQRAFSALSEEERAAMLKLFRRLNSAMDEEMRGI